MFPDSNLPCRLILVFVETEAKVGNYSKNPFEFNRKWTYTVAENLRTNKESNIEERMKKLEEQFESFSAKLRLPRPDQSKETETFEDVEVESRIITEAKKRLRSFLTIPNISVHDDNDLSSEAESEFVTVNEELETTKTVYIQKIEVLLNSNPIDQVEDNQTGSKIVSKYF